MAKFKPPKSYADQRFKYESPYPLNKPSPLIPHDLIPLPLPRPRPLPDNPYEPTHVQFMLRTAHTTTVLCGFALPRKRPIPIDVLGVWVQAQIAAESMVIHMHYSNTFALHWLQRTIEHYGLEAHPANFHPVAKVLARWTATKRPFDILIELFDGDVCHPAARTTVEAASQSLHEYLTGLWLQKAEDAAHEVAKRRMMEDQDRYTLVMRNVRDNMKLGRFP